VRVSDRGPGVPPVDRERIFERFYRAGRPRGAAPVTGFGLGLAIARGFVKAHDGRLWVEDRPSGGASFVVALPLAGRVTAPAEDGAAAGRP
jgi:signal transduction histidine kinase